MSTSTLISYWSSYGKTVGTVSKYYYYFRLIDKTLQIVLQKRELENDKNNI